MVHLSAQAVFLLSAINPNPVPNIALKTDIVSKMVNVCVSIITMVRPVNALILFCSETASQPVPKDQRQKNLQKIVCQQHNQVFTLPPMALKRHANPHARHVSRLKPNALHVIP